MNYDPRRGLWIPDSVAPKPQVFPPHLEIPSDTKGPTKINTDTDCTRRGYWEMADPIVKRNQRCANTNPNGPPNNPPPVSQVRP